ncbi:MAG: hypothetical protein GY820_35425 [Gammaproteobacteria bacterium]|nr:hypothetical protein [Gammaproteobacteria bacterium]
MVKLVPTVLIVLTLLTSASYGAELTVLTQNLNRLFNDVDDGNREKVVSSKAYRQRISGIADKIQWQFGFPQIIALQEVENLKVLGDVAKAVVKNNGPSYQPILLEGNDRSGIDVGFLINSGFAIRQQYQLFKNAVFKRNFLFSRPPLVVELCYKPGCITLVNLHLRSMRGLGSVGKGKTVALKRLQQAAKLAHWVNQFQLDKPNSSVMLLGDFNALTPGDKYADIVGTLRGDPDNAKVTYPAKDWISMDLVDITRQINIPARFSYVYKNKKQILDYILINQHFKPQLLATGFSNIDRKFSDHAGLWARFSW